MIRNETHIDTASDETAEEKAAIQDAVGNVAQLDVLRATSAQTTDGAIHSDGAECNKADDDDLSPWRVIWRRVVSRLFIERKSIASRALHRNLPIWSEARFFPSIASVLWRQSLYHRDR